MTNPDHPPNGVEAKPAATKRSAALSTVVGLLLAAPLLGDWTTQSPLPTHLAVRGVAAPTAQRVFVGTEDDSFDDSGALFESTDGGVTWTQRAVPANGWSAINGLYFLDHQLGWAWGNENLRTTDGGDTWEPLPFLGSTYGMRFHTADFGVASGNFGVRISHDGGLHWVESPGGMTSFSFADQLTGLGVSATDGILRTIDGGLTFLPVSAGAARAVAFLSASVAVGIVDDTFVRSTDGGLTWTSGAPALGRRALLAVAAEVVLAWGRGGSFPDFDDRVLRSADGGQTWSDLGEVIPGATNAAPFAFAVPASGVVVASDGMGGIHRSADAGATWSQVYTSPGPGPGFLHNGGPVFGDALHGYFAYGPGFVVRTRDGGATWEQVSSGIGDGLRAVDRFPSGGLVAVGDAGRVLTSTDGEAPWLLRATLPTESLQDVQAFDGGVALALAKNGALYRSADGGLTWSGPSAAPTGLGTANALGFTTPTDGWVVGQGSTGKTVFHTTNGGSSRRDP